MKLRDLLEQSAQKLHSSSTPVLDTRLLLQHLTNLSVADIYLQPELEISQAIINQYQQLIERRMNNEPIAKILGKKAFWNSEFQVNQYTLDPRPDSEVIIASAIRLLPQATKLRFLDLGTGSGCLILSLVQEFPMASAIAIDISDEALKIAQANAISLGLQERITFIQQNWADGLIEQFDLIVSNPPYIPSQDIAQLADDVKSYDPLLALDGGLDGLDPYRYLAKQLSPLMKQDAYAILEFGYGQSKEIQEIFKAYRCNEILKDLNNTERAIILKSP